MLPMSLSERILRYFVELMTDKAIRNPMHTGKKIPPTTKSISGDTTKKQRGTGKGKRDLFRKIILHWYEKNHRKLPWRENPTPYRVWISEIMLQQTQAKTAIPYYNRFLKRYPNITALAHAPFEDILTLWSGLGYYHRAQNIHKTAQKIVQDYKGCFPTDYATIFSLPGIGRYTAGAICSIALNQPKPVVDGNIRRVLIRINGVRRRMPEKYFWKRMTALVPKDKASVFNQAIMELGAVICLPSKPLCPQCPVHDSCRAKKQNLQNEIPSPKSRKTVHSVELAVLVIKRRGRILLAHQETDFIPGLWGLPNEVISAKNSAESTAETLGGRITRNRMQIDYSGQLHHSITHHRIRVHIFRCRIRDISLRLSTEGSRMYWATRAQTYRMVTSSLFKKVLDSLKKEI